MLYLLDVINVHNDITNMIASVCKLHVLENITSLSRVDLMSTKS